jgi:hypothetical protein
MKPNVVILTSGLAGSSVLTGLVARAGYWTGDATFKKEDYDTYENQELVALNQRLFREVDYAGDHTVRFSPEGIQRIAEAYGKIDAKPYSTFLEKCEQHRPWVWKDPRLWLTIRFWQHLLDLDHCRFVLLNRDIFQTWVSITLRRQIQSYAYLDRYMDGVKNSLVEFLRSNKLSYLDLEYEDLILRPDTTIERLNTFLGTSLSIGDLQQVYTKPLYKRPRAWLDYPKAMLIYLKNYGQRYR